MLLEEYKTLGIAFSGGVDSSLLTWLLKNGLKKSVHVFMAVSIFLSNREKRAAQEVAAALGVSIEEVHTDPLAHPLVAEGSPDRCYFCKRMIMEGILERAGKLGCHAVVEGSHLEDLDGHRPGRRALRELGILSPLAESGFRKEEVRTLARLARLPNWNKPSQSCLATRVPHGVRLSVELLHRIDQAESVLWQEGCRQVRVRAHGNLARIEIGEMDFPLLLQIPSRARIVEALGSLGFDHVTLDLKGFQSGSMDREQQTMDGVSRDRHR